MEMGKVNPSSENDDAMLKKDIIEDSRIENGSTQEEAADAIETRKIIRKIDWRLIPLLTLLYFLTFLDRVNIGNARLWNLERDLNMTGYQYNIAVIVFYIPVILMEIPSNIIINRVQPRYWIAGLTLGFGLSVTFAGFSKSFGGLIAARIFIGFFEAGMAGCLFLIGSWYRRHELLTRVAFFMTANDIAGSISGLLGAGLGSMDGIGGYSGWSWIFFIEGAITALAAVMAFFLILPFPEDTDFLPPEEKAWLLRRLHHDDKRGEVEKITTWAALKALMDWKVICAGMLFLSVTITGYSITVFQPTILSTFGWSDLKSNLLSAPVRIAAGIVSVLFGIWSDKAKRRGPFCLFGFTLSIIGKLFVMLFTNGNLRYMGIYVASIGTYICQPLVLAWGVNQVVGNIKRGTLSSFAVCMGQVGGIISAVVFPKKDSPQYVPGLGTCIAFDVIAIICALSYWIYGAWENRQRDLGRRDYLRELPESESEKLGDRHPDFRYTV